YWPSKPVHISNYLLTWEEACDMICRNVCGVPNLNLYPSNRADTDEGRPKGHGQKQKNGELGLGKVLGSDLELYQIGGMILNQGVDLGALGHRIGKGPARSMNALTHGYPSFGIGGEPNNGDKKTQPRSSEIVWCAEFTWPQQRNRVNKLLPTSQLLGKLGGNRSNKRVLGYEPGYGAINPNAPIAIGKVDHDAINLPGGFGEVEIGKGGGFGIGKR
ncbi:hypothetical protein KIN20_035608, partial [Parelaphostrongylus tenuis]